MNDNQYIAHSGVVCHYGVKGMKWGKHLKAAIDDYKEFDQLDKLTLNKVNQNNVAYDAYTKGKQEYNSRVTRNGDPKSNYDRQRDAQKLQGLYNAYKRADAEEASAIKKLRTVYPSKISTPTIFGQQLNLPAIGKGVKADISDAYNSAKSSIGKGYRIIKNKAGQVFGKPKITTKITNNGPVPHAGPLSYSETKKGIFGIPITTKYIDRGPVKRNERKRK